MKSNLFKSFLAFGVAVVMATSSFCVSAQDSFNKDTQQEVALLFLKPMEEGAKASIGYNGITDVHVFASGEYAISLFIVDGLNSLSEADLAALKQGLIKDYQKSEMLDTYPILEEVTGLKGLKFIYKDKNSCESFTITINFKEITNSK